MALVCQVVTVDKTLFAERVSTLPQRVVSELERGLGLVQGLGEARS